MMQPRIRILSSFAQFHAQVPRSVAAACRVPRPEASVTWAGPDVFGTRRLSSASAAAPNADAALVAKNDDEIVQLLLTGRVRLPELESRLQDFARSVGIRRKYYRLQMDAADASASVGSQDSEDTAAAKNAGDHQQAAAVAEASTEETHVSAKTRSAAFSHLPVTGFHAEAFYRGIHGRNCENVVGFVPIPVGIVGPLRIDGKDFHVPMATTEGALVASTNRGCRAITEAGGATTIVTGDGMTRAPVLRMPTLQAVSRLHKWLTDPVSYGKLKAAFDSTSNYGRLKEISFHSAGRNVYLRFLSATGDAMGMNMISKAVSVALEIIKEEFPGTRLVAVSGNVCIDKKPSAINWIKGRGKSVTVEVVLSSRVLSTVLKTTAPKMVEMCVTKNLVGSSLAGSVGGMNAHASNMVTAVFLATGQDPAQNVESSNCMTLAELADDGESLIASVTMPSIEVGTVGGGTALPAQRAMLDLLGCGGASADTPGANAVQLARIVASTVLAGELSLMAALSSNDLVKAHMELGRKPTGPSGPVGSNTPGTRGLSTVAALRGKSSGRVFSRASQSPGMAFFTPASERKSVPLEEFDGPFLTVP